MPSIFDYIDGSTLNDIIHTSPSLTRDTIKEIKNGDKLIYAPGRGLEMHIVEAKQDGQTSDGDTFTGVIINW